MDLIKFAKQVREAIDGGSVSPEFIEKRNYSFGVRIAGDQVIVMYKNGLSGIYNLLSKIVRNRDYELEIKGLIDGVSKSVKKTYPSDESVENAIKDLCEGRKIESIYMISVKMDEIEIVEESSGMTRIKCPNPRKIFYIVSSILPLIDVKDKNSYRVEVVIDRIDETKRIGRIVAKINLDGKQAGIKSNYFVIES